MREVLGAEPDEHQVALLTAVARGERRVSVRSGHGVGKTTVLAWLIVWHLLTRFPQKTVCTAATSAQLMDALAAEAKAWVGKLPVALQETIDIKSEKIELKGAPNESFVSFRTSRPEAPEALAGVHADHVLLIADEASGIPPQVFEAAIGSMSAHNAVMVLAGNPVRSSGLFYDTHHKLKANWFTHVISCVGHPRVAQDLVAQVRDTYGEKSNAYRVRILGEFPLADDDTVIPFELAEAARTRDIVPTPGADIVWGVDVGRFGNDPSALAKRQGTVLREPVTTRQGLDTMQVVGWIKSEYDAAAPHERPQEILVDVIGLGAGVVDRSRELKLPVRGINVSESAALSDKFVNQRAELWWRGREALAKRDCSLNNDGGLVGELIGPRYTITSGGKIQVESKADMKKRGLQSPNKADAWLLTYARDAATAAGMSSRKSWGTAIKRGIKGLV